MYLGIEVMNECVRCDLTSTQEVVWLDQLITPDAPCYNIGGFFVLKGKVDVKRLNLAISQVIANHDALRITITETDTGAYQQFNDSMEFQLQFVDFSSFEDAEQRALRYCSSELVKPFSLYENRLWNMQWLKINDEQGYWFFCYHHLISDGVSVTLIRTAVANAYNQSQQNLHHIEMQAPQYQKFIDQDKLYLSSNRYKKDKNFWLEHFDTAPEPVFVKQNQNTENQVVNQLTWRMPQEVFTKISELSIAVGCSKTHFFMAIIAIYFTRAFGERDNLVIGMPVHNRSNNDQKKTVGMYSSVIPVHVSIDRELTFEQTMQVFASQLKRIYRHQRFPMSEITRQLRNGKGARFSLYDISLSVEDMSSDVEFNDIDSTLVPLHNGFEPQPLTIAIQAYDKREDVLIHFNYDLNFFNRDDIEQHQQRIECLVLKAIDQPKSKVSSMPILATGELEQLMCFNGPAVNYNGSLSVHGRFEAQVESVPAAVAAVSYFDNNKHSLGELSYTNRQQISYQQLNQKANQVAHYLKFQGVKANTLVGIYCHRSIDFLIAVLGILKAGGAYVPLDPTNPIERLNYMVSDSKVNIILSQEALAGSIKLPDTCQCAFLDKCDVFNAYSPLNPKNETLPEDLAYMIYTSGSTGMPKGALVHHGGALNHLDAEFDLLGFIKNDELQAVNFLQSAASSSDVSVWQFLAPVASGGKTVILEDMTDLAKCTFLMKHEQVHLIQTAPVVLQMLLEHLDSLPVDEAQLPDLRWLMTIAEACPVALVNRWFTSYPNIPIMNGFGPSEASDDITYHIMHERLNSDVLTVPIGQAIPNMSMYVLDKFQQLQPIGVVGELCVSGVGVGPGYWNNTERTDESFIANPFAGEANCHGDRLYRTGDLGRWHKEGYLEFIGRLDNQVKIRGFRVELGEVEAALANIDGVGDVAVIVHQSRLKESTLAAYLVNQRKDVLSVSELRDILAMSLPAYMIPTSFTWLDSMPLNAADKIDRKALPQPDISQEENIYLAPMSELEINICDIWQSVLGIERIGLSDNFFLLGGHSLLAVQLISHLRKQLAIEIPLNSLFVYPVLTDFVKEVAQNKIHVVNRIELADRTKPLALSYAQQRLWFIDQMDKQASASYHVPGGLRLKGALNELALTAALNRIIERHEILHTHFVMVDGQSQQVIESQHHFVISKQDMQNATLTDYQEVCQQEANQSFDLTKGPLIRAKLIKVASDEHVLLLTMHHIISDGWSIGVLIKEFSALYSAFCHGFDDPLPTLEIQYADFAIWQRECLQVTLEKQKAYWMSQLSAVPELVALPTDRIRPESQDYNGARIDLVLDRNVSQRLKVFSNQQGTTLYMTLLAAWATLVSRLSSQEQVVIGSPNANRNRVELESLIGFFVNSQAMVVDFSEELSVSELLLQVKETSLLAQANQDIPFEQVVEAVNPTRSIAHSPIFQLMFTWENTPTTNLQFGDLSLVIEETDHFMAQYDLSLDLQEIDDEIVGTFIYATALYDEATVKHHWGYLQKILIGMMDNPSQKIGKISFLSTNEVNQLLTNFNRFAVPYDGACSIQGRFEEQVCKSPETIAAVSKTDNSSSKITYQQLNHRANKVANYLIGQDVKPNVLVGLYCNRSIDFLVGVLGILKAGGAYVPLDPTNPSERLSHMIDDSQISVMLSQLSLKDSLSLPSSCQCVYLDEEDQFLTYADNNPEVNVTSDDLAYMIYTSGSTGTPKGALVHHGGALNHIDAEFDLLGLIKNDELQPTNFLQSAASSSDVSVWQFLAPVVSGGKTVILDNMTNLPKCIELMQQEQVHLIQTAPVVLQFLLDYLDKLPSHLSALPDLRWLMTIAEACPVPLINRWFASYPNIPIMNGFGPSEASDDVTYHIMRERLGSDILTVPIGQAIPNMSMYVLDKYQQLQPIGVVGELCVSGVGVGPGYWNNTERTDESFIANPFAGEANCHGDRLYRTGDLGRWHKEGYLEFIGRVDNQVKIRGFRVELGEVEAALAKVDGIGDVAVIINTNSNGENSLAAYLVLATSSYDLDITDLRSIMKDRLPEYMIPSSFTFLETMPLNAADKIDRKALPIPDVNCALSNYIAPETEIEKKLANIWQELLAVERVGLSDSFFDLGGHSLLTLTSIERMKQQNLYIDVAVLFKTPTLAEVAAQTSTQSNEIEVPLNLLSSIFTDEPEEINNEGSIEYEDYDFDEEYEITLECEQNKSSEEVS
jgi:amino acid adenylation domain-containing protein